MEFKLVSEFSPTGDQPQAIQELSDGINTGEKFQTLLGVTGSGKTFTVANVIQEVKKPTLVLAHNKTLAAQLYSEFKQFFPENAVEYFVSYYDYYQPEAYIPVTGTYIEKDLSINEDIERLRLSTTSSLLSVVRPSKTKVFRVSLTPLSTTSPHLLKFLHSLRLIQKVTRLANSPSSLLTAHSVLLPSRSWTTSMALLLSHVFTQVNLKRELPSSTPSPVRPNVSAASLK